MMESRYRWRCRRVCGDHGGAALRWGMPKIEGRIFDTRTRLFVLAFWTQEFAIAAAHQGEATLHEADGTIAQIMRLPGALRDTLPAKKTFGDRTIGFALIASVQRTQDQGKPLAPLRRDVGQQRTRRMAAQRTPERLGSLGAELKRRVQWQLDRLRCASGRQFLHPHAMRGATEPEHGMPAVCVLPQLAGRQSCQIQSDRLS
jgi:hypothetical protein